MLDKDGNIKIIDFGSSVIKQKKESVWTIESRSDLGTAGYEAPELILAEYKEQQIDEKIDIWLVLKNLCLFLTYYIFEWFYGNLLNKNEGLSLV